MAYKIVYPNGFVEYALSREWVAKYVSVGFPKHRLPLSPDFPSRALPKNKHLAGRHRKQLTTVTLP